MPENIPTPGALEGVDSTTGFPRKILSDGDALHSWLMSLIAGERNPDSATNSHLIVHEEGNYTFFNPDATTEQVISSAPVYLYGFIGKAGTGTLTLRDDSTAAGSTTPLPVFTLAVGTIVELPCAVRFDTGLTAQCGTGTDEVTLFWRAQ